eukprot:88449_1
MANTTGDFDYKNFRREWDNLLERQKYKEAEKLCHEGLAKSPLDQSRGRLYNHLGYLYENYLDDKTFDDILEHYVLSLQVDESNANSHYNLANFLLEQGMQHLLRALELNPNHNKANKRYANLTPIKTHSTLDMGGSKYQVLEVVEDGVRAVRLRKRNDGSYERTDDEPEYVEVGSPEKVYPSSSNNAGGRTKNMGNNQPVPLNIDDQTSNQSQTTNDGGCCYKCVYFWWFWCLLLLLALGGVAVPVLAYFDILPGTTCVDKISAEQIALNTDSGTQGTLNILFVMDCGADDWDEQFTVANTLVEEINTRDAVRVSVQLAQYCNADGIGMYVGDINDTNSDFGEYTAANPIDSTTWGMTQATAVGGNNNLVSGALDACKDLYSSLDNTDTSPFLCMPFVSHEFDDAFDAMSVTADAAFADLYVAFMVDEEDPDYTDNVYPVLGALATGATCIDRMDSDHAFGNTWWGSKFNCDSNTLQHNDCPHCINYAVNQELACAAVEIEAIFSDEGVTESKVTVEKDGECTHEYDTYFFYAIGGVVPLLLWVIVVVFVLCCHQCRSRNRRNNMEQHNGLNNNDPKAFV